MADFYVICNNASCLMAINEQRGQHYMPSLYVTLCSIFISPVPGLLRIRQIHESCSLALQTA